MLFRYICIIALDFLHYFIENKMCENIVNLSSNFL